MKELLEGLNEAQRDAVTCDTGPMLVLAGAGSGKTRVLTLRLGWLVTERGVPPWELLAVTFTNKAAGEMRERVADLLGPRGRELWVSTFHSTCLRILRNEIEHLDGFSRNFVIYDDRDSKELVKRILKDGRYPSTVNPKAIRAAIDRAKNEGRTPRQLADDPPPNLPAGAQEIYAIYQERLRASNAVDFGDLIFHTLRLFESKQEVLDKYRTRFKHLLVDEYQDTNHVQYRLVRLLADHGDRNVCVVGDEDQSIYSFRGADIRNILDFERDFPGAKVVRLERNYRSTEVILRAAGAVVAQNQDRLGKALWTDRSDGDPIRLETAYDDREEARFAVDIVRREINRGTQPKEIAVFYRTNAQSRLLEEEFLAARLPFVLVGGQRFFDRREVKDALSYLKLIVNPNDEVALLRVINNPPRGIGDKTYAVVRQIARERSVTAWEALDAIADEPAGKSMSKRPASALTQFRDLVRGLREVARTQPLPELLEAIYERTGMVERFREEQSFEADGRIDNLEELLNSTADYAGAEPPSGLLLFLDRVSLVADTDAIPDPSDTAGKVTMMTVHSAKGLEFPVVLVVGLDEKTFPHARSLDFQAQLEEERRLAYVAITRAEDRLYLLRARRRPAGEKRMYEDTLPSRFLRDIPRELMAGADFLGNAAPPKPPRGSEGPGEPWVEYELEAPRGAGRSRFDAAVARRRQVAKEREDQAGRRQRAVATAATSARFQAPRPGAPAGPAAPTPDVPPALSPVVEQRSLFSAPAPAGNKHRPRVSPVVAAPPADQEPRVVYDSPGYPSDDDAADMLAPGTRVYHQDFGEGEIRSLDGPSGNRRATVFFKRAGLKRLYLRSTGLEVLGR